MLSDTGIRETSSHNRYDLLNEGVRSALVAQAWPQPVVAALLERQGCLPALLGGRGAVWRFELPDGKGILRQYRRGGLARRLLKDTFLLRNRPLQEFRVHLYLYRHGLPVPEPLGVAWERQGLLFGGALATRELAGRNLFDYLAAAPRYPEDTLRRVGSLIREMHDLGVYHADLQVRNIFVGYDRVYLMDFDNARQAPRVSPLHRARNLLRLRRSFDTCYLPIRFFQLVCEGYGGRRLPLWLRLVYSAKGKLSDLLSGRSGAREP